MKLARLEHLAAFGVVERQVVFGDVELNGAALALLQVYAAEAFQLLYGLIDATGSRT